MALFVLIVLIINCCLTSLLGSEYSNNKYLEIHSPSMTGGQPLAIYKVDDTLNLTCLYTNDLNISDVVLDWTVPSKPSNSRNRVLHEHGLNSANLVIQNLQENDSGDYKCRASHNGSPAQNFETSVRINVKKKECSEVMFQCHAGNCIPRRYTCDGHRDCKGGEDESLKQCGTDNPCDNKLPCPDKRCIPRTWCCDTRDPNCTAKVKLSCCEHSLKSNEERDSDPGFQPEQHQYKDMGHLETTVYAVIGCAMAFMFIVTIIVIAICRVHMRRTLLSRCPRVNVRNLGNGRGANLHASNVQYLDANAYFNLTRFNSNNLMSINPLLVTYNINNGVQFVGRPIDPPPYCEILTSPPLEGPPPPYTSKENLYRDDKVELEIKESSESCLEPEVTESDALLGAASLQNNMNVISSSAVDVTNNTELPTNFICSKSEEIVSNTGDLEKGDILKDSLDNCNVSSHQDQCVLKNIEDANAYESGTLDILVLKSDHGESTMDSHENFKTGESSSIVAENFSDISKGAIKKMASSKSFDNRSRCRSKNSQKSDMDKV